MKIRVRIRVSVRAELRVRIRVRVYSVHQAINSVHHQLGRVFSPWCNGSEI